MNLTFSALRFANKHRNEECDPSNKITASFRGLELSSEVGGLCSMVKRLERERMGLHGSRATLLELAEKLADVQISLDLLAMHYSLDLGVITHMKFNDTSEKYNLQTLMTSSDTLGGGDDAEILKFLRQ
jgi:hypothetical protein